MRPEQAGRLHVEIADATTRARVMTAGRTADALMDRPRKDAWSVAETLEHLVLTADAMLPLLDTAIADLERTKRRASRPAGLGFMGWLLVKALEPPPRMKSRTAKPFEPVDVSVPTEVAERLATAHARLDALVTRATGLDTARASVISPFNAKVRYNVYAAFRIMLAHARRHIFQAAEAARATGV